MVSYISEVNEINYTDKHGKLYARLEMDWSDNSSIMLSYKDNKKLIFISKNSENKEIEDFWDNLVKSASEKKLKNLERVIDEMKKRFEIKS